jgi:hypothetical protein
MVTRVVMLVPQLLDLLIAHAPILVAPPLGLNSSTNSSFSPFGPVERSSLITRCSGAEGVAVGDGLEVDEPVWVGEAESVGVGVEEPVWVGEAVSVGVSVSVIVLVNVKVLDSVRVFVLVKVNVGVGVAGHSA